MNISFSDQQSTKRFVTQLNLYGFPGAWTIRAAVLSLIARLYDVWFVFSTLRKDNFYFETYGKHQFKLRKATGDKYVVDEIWTNHDYGPPPSGVVLDLGGNIGAFAIYAAQKAERVFSLEPVSTNYNLLQDNLELNSVSNVHPIKLAVSDFTGERTINISPINLGRSSFLRVGSDTPTESIPCTTLDAIVHELQIPHIDLIKCDIEGGEFSAFPYKSSKALSIASKIVMEIHCNPVKPRIVYKLLRRMQRSGFSITLQNPRFLRATGLGIIIFSKQPNS